MSLLRHDISYREQDIKRMGRETLRDINLHYVVCPFCHIAIDVYTFIETDSRLVSGVLSSAFDSALIDPVLVKLEYLLLNYNFIPKDQPQDGLRRGLIFFIPPARYEDVTDTLSEWEQGVIEDLLMCNKIRMPCCYHVSNLSLIKTATRQAVEQPMTLKEFLGK